MWSSTHAWHNEHYNGDFLAQENKPLKSWPCTKASGHRTINRKYGFEFCGSVIFYVRF